MAWYWFIARLFISFYKHAKENLAKIQPSWPYTLSKTHTYCKDKSDVKGLEWVIINHNNMNLDSVTSLLYIYFGLVGGQSLIPNCVIFQHASYKIYWVPMRP